jgi:hypothetical protein
VKVREGLIIQRSSTLPLEDVSSNIDHSKGEQVQFRISFIREAVGYMDMTGQSNGVSYDTTQHETWFILGVDKLEEVYFFWPVALLKVSVTAWPALLRPC